MTKQETQKNLYTRHSKSTDTLAAINDRAKTTNVMDPGNAQFWRDGLQVNVVGYDILNARIGVNVHKLLSFGITSFTKQYNKVNSESKYDVSFLLDDYILLTGGTIPDDPEQRRRKRNEAQKRIKNELQLLQAIQIVNDQDAIFQSMSLVSFTRIRNGVVTIEFSRRFAEYLLGQNLTVIPSPLFRIAARSRTAYTMGIKCSEYYYMNRHKEQACRLKVRNLLKVTDLPDYETVLRDRKSWRERIKQPFETGMNELITAGVLRSWRYADRNAGKNYQTFSDALIIFEMTGKKVG